MSVNAAQAAPGEILTHPDFIPGTNIFSDITLTPIDPLEGDVLSGRIMASVGIHNEQSFAIGTFDEEAGRIVPRTRHMVHGIDQLEDGTYRLHLEDGCYRIDSTAITKQVPLKKPSSSRLARLASTTRHMLNSVFSW